MKRALSKHLFAMLLSAVLAGCASPGIPQPPSLELPKPVTDLTAVRRNDKVYLSWTVPTQTTDGKRIRRAGLTRICRTSGAAMKSCQSVDELRTLVAPSASAVPGRADYTYVLPPALLSDDPAARITYAVSVENSRGRSAGLSNQASVLAVRALPPPEDLAAKVTADGIVLSWKNTVTVVHRPGLTDVVRIFRRDESSQVESVAGEAPLDAPTTFTDRNFEWEKAYSYRAAVVTTLSQPAPAGSGSLEMEGEQTLPLTIVAHDIFPPAVPAGLQAVFSGAEQGRYIDLIWSPDADADLAGYNVYRREENGAPQRINSAIVQTPAFRDTDVSSGKKYFYSVSAVDVRGNESARSEEASEVTP
ncbi:MAG: hypothetical protein JOY93_04125 [Acidobacteriales bacterium]|nr:hypothetical protein [Terriglobales bacterium]